MKRLKRQAFMLVHMKKCGRKVCNELIRIAPNDLIKVFVEILHNINRGNVTLSGKQLKSLSKFKRACKLMLHKSTSLKTRKTLLQKGGFISAIVMPILGLLGSLIGEAIARKS